MGGTRCSSSSARGLPERPADAQKAPIGRAPVADGRSEEFAFVSTQDDSPDPVTYDPCVPIHLVVDPRTIVEGGMKLFEEALDEVRDATGLTFVVDGLTDEAPPEAGAVTGPDGKWLPVTVSWSDPGASERLTGDVAGYAGSTSVVRGDRRWFVTGSVVLDGPQLAKILDRRRGRNAARSVMMHELGHLVGLDHVDSSRQLMRPEGTDNLTTWGDGDLTGLAALGRGACIDY